MSIQHEDVYIRRNLIKGLTVGGGIAVVGCWTKPIVNSVLLPAHAQTSNDAVETAQQTIDVIEGGADAISVSQVPIGERFFEGGPIPVNLEELNSSGALGQATVWIGGEFVTLGDASTAHWDGSIWAVGVAPAVTLEGTLAGTPGSFPPAGAAPPADLAALITAHPIADPTDAWTTGQHVITNDGLLAHWDATDYIIGAAP